MQGSTALIVAGTVALVAGLAGPTLAADDPVRDTPAAEVTEAETTTPSEPAEPLDVDETPTGPGPVAVSEEEGDRDAPEVETQEVEGAEPEGEDAEKKRGPARQDDADKEKQPLKSYTVVIEDFEYRPDPIDVEPGDEVTWTNRDTAQHSATAEGKGDFDTGLLEKGEKASVPFNDEGTFQYICSVHPDMKGEVRVRSASSSDGDSDDTSTDTGTTSDTTFDSSTPSTTDFGGSSNSNSGSLPNTGQNELPLLLLGAGLIVLGLLARAFHEYWIWR